MIHWANRVDLSDEVGEMLTNHEFEKQVTFVYMHKSGRETERRFSLEDAINLAEARRNDGRYKNYEFFIYA